MPNLTMCRVGVLVLWLAPATVLAQDAPAEPPPSSSNPPAAAPEPVPLSPREVDRIQRALNQPQSLKLDEQQLRFYLEIVARLPTFAEYARGYDFLHGPTRRGNPMSHQEFLDLVTPKEMHSSAGITASEQVQFALTNYVAQSLILRALEQLKQAKDAREIQEIRDRIDRELDALTGASRTPRPQ